MHTFQSIKQECIDHSFKELLTIHSKSLTVWVNWLYANEWEKNTYLARSFQWLPPRVWKSRITTGIVNAKFRIPHAQLEYKVEVTKKKLCSRWKPVNSWKRIACTECEAGMEVDKIENSTCKIKLHGGLHVKKKLCSTCKALTFVE